MFSCLNCGYSRSIVYTDIKNNKTKSILSNVNAYMLCVGTYILYVVTRITDAIQQITCTVVMQINNCFFYFLLLFEFFLRHLTAIGRNILYIIYYKNYFSFLYI